MTPNFKILKEKKIWVDQKKIREYIENIENYIDDWDKSSDEDHRRQEIKRLVALNSGYFNEAIADWEKDYNSDNSLPATINDSRHAIRKFRNNVVHLDSNDTLHYNHTVDKFSFISILKSMYMIIVHYALEKNVIDSYDINENYRWKPDWYDKSISNLINGEKNDVEDWNISNVSSKIFRITDLIGRVDGFFIPFYQRKYVWEDGNIALTTFLSDILERNEDGGEHYMGVIAIKPMPNGVWDLVDGQQRITTSLLLLRAMLNYFYEKNEMAPAELKKINENIDKKIQNSNEGELENIRKILNSGAGQVLWGESMKNPSRVYKNYKIILTWLQKMTSIEVRSIFDTFWTRFVVAIVEFKDPSVNEMEIFANINGTGVPLEKWDLIKNLIYKKVDQNFLLNSSKIVENKIRKEFELPTFLAQKKFTYLKDFFEHLVRIKISTGFAKGLSHDKDLISNLEIIFSGFMKKARILNENDLDEFLSPILRLFTIYNEISLADKYKDERSKLNFLQLYITNTNEKDAHYPLVIYAISQSVTWDSAYNHKIYKIEPREKEELKQLYELIEKYLVRLIITRGTGQSLAKLFDKCIGKGVSNSQIIKNFIKEINNDESDSKNTIPTFFEFQRALKNANDSYYCESALRKLEAYKSKDSNFRSNLTLEHIVPQKFKKDADVYREYGYRDLSKLENDHRENVNRLGNLLFIKDTSNSRMSNKSFFEKKKVYEDHSSVLINGSKDGKLMNLLEKNTFTIEDIKNRSTQLADLIAPLYKINEIDN